MRASSLLRSLKVVSRRSPINPVVCSFHSSSLRAATNGVTTPHADPQLKNYKFWNREESTPGQFSYLLEISPESIQKEARIISLTAPDDEANHALHEGALPMGCRLLGTGSTLQDFNELRNSDQQPNVVFVSPSCPKARVQLPLVLAAFPTIEWIHCRSAGIDFVVSDALVGYKHIPCTNAKGQFSSSLAEYTMMACSYFAKDLPRLMRQKKEKNWAKYEVEELRGKTMGIVGYGDIGRACAKIAHVYGMKIVALRRNPSISEVDPLCDVVYGTGKSSLNKLMSESDYIVCSAPSTVETRGMVNADAFKAVKENAVFINLGRGPVVDEKALIEALKTGRLRGAALDVFIEEPLPPESEFWDVSNVLISPHNMDQTGSFMHEATEFFVNENLPRFVCGEDLLNPVDVEIGY
mmetsp:Transcript_22535/g.31605  ORF Transcript_22535/g.31605 Transcript_22535/m.31605 type:complete len:410 (-) Transcript_22535:60-1289(-)